MRQDLQLTLVEPNAFALRALIDRHMAEGLCHKLDAAPRALVPFGGDLRSALSVGFRAEFFAQVGVEAEEVFVFVAAGGVFDGHGVLW